MPKKEKSTPQKKGNLWIVYVGIMLLLIAGILYLDYREKKANMPPSMPTALSVEVSPTPTPAPIFTDEEIEGILALKDPLVFYFYSTEKCIMCPVQSNSLLIRLQDFNIKVINVSIENNKDVFMLFDVAEYPMLVLYQQQELYRQKVVGTENPDEIISVIKEKFGIP